MTYRLEVGEKESLKIKARHRYSEDHLCVKEGEVYRFTVDKKDKWVDFFRPCNADGFDNVFLADRRKRVPGVKCFVLCGTIGQNEEDHFVLGTSPEDWQAPKEGKLYFFPNDDIRFYGNNFGKILLKVERIK